MSADSLKLMLAPRSMAVIGASSDPKRMSGMIVEQARRLGFTGDIYPINPRHEEIAGLTCYPSVLDLKDNPPEVAVIYLSAASAVKAARECAQIGVRSLIVLSAGFSETGAEGAELQSELAEICRTSGMAMCGPNTAGLANFNVGFVAYGASGFSGLSAQGGGNIAIVSSSGGVGTTLMAYCQSRGLGVSHLIGIGNEGVTTAADYLSALIDDPDVSAVILLLESIRDRHTFFAAADRALTAGKQVIVMKQGRSAVGMRSIQTHTAAMGGSAADFEAACRAHGIIVVRELRALADQAVLATQLGRVDGWQIGVLSLPGGGTSLLGDAASENGFTLPSLSDEVTAELGPILPSIATVGNPLDPTAGFGRDSERLQSTIELFASSDTFDVVFFFQSHSEAAYCVNIATALINARARMDKPLIVVWEAGSGLDEAWAMLREAHIPLFTSTMDAFGALARHRAVVSKLDEAVDDDFGPGVADFVVPDRGSPEGWTDTLLTAIGVPRPTTICATDAESAVAAADQIGYPVVMKLLSSTVVHKSDIGGVHLGVANEVDVAEAFSAIKNAVTKAAGAAAFEGVEVQQTIPPGVEMLLGVHTDEQVGPLVTIGFGGVMTELISDISTRPAPVSRADVSDMIDEVKVGQLLHGFRGSPPAEVDGFVELVQRVAWAAHQLADSSPELELNPVIVGKQGTHPIAVDWVVR
jgi:acyl-CoA synthetase (NDP forming)